MYGKGMFIHKIRTAMGGDVVAIAEKATELELDYLAVKINRGYYSYNWRLLSDGKTWVDDYIPMLKVELDKIKVDLWGWGSVWLLDGKAEAEKAIERMEKFGLVHYMSDAEGQAKSSSNRYTQADRYSLTMNARKTFLHGLCSYRYPTVHPELPWTKLLASMDFHAPQVYWIHGSDPAGQLKRSIGELNAIKELPFLPAGPAFSEHGWKPTLNEVNLFDRACKEQGCEGVCWWEFDEAYDEGFFDSIAMHNWRDTTPAPLGLEEKIDLLHQAVKTYHQTSLWDTPDGNSTA